jgi:hypothetical protein
VLTFLYFLRKKFGTFNCQIKNAMHSDGVRGAIIPNKKEPNLPKFRFFLFGKISPIKISPQTPSLTASTSSENKYPYFRILLITDDIHLPPSEPALCLYV